MKLTIVLRRFDAGSQRSGIFSARVRQGNQLGKNLIGGRSLTNVESAKRAAREALLDAGVAVAADDVPIRNRFGFTMKQPEAAFCHACGQEWPRDPALEVECPKCQAKVGHYCVVRRPSGHTANFGNKTLIHPDRDQLAMDRGFLQRCPAAAKLQTSPAPEQRDLFAPDARNALPETRPDA